MGNKYFPTIDSTEVARSLAKQGALGALLFAAMNVGGVLFALYAKLSPTTGQGMSEQGIQDMVIGASMLMPVLLFMAWRIYRGKGWISGGIMLLWFFAEIATKIVGGTTNVGWVIMYFFIAAMLVNGVRACWWLRRNNSVIENIDASKLEGKG